MDADCVKVAVRIRPLVKSEIERGCQNVIEKVPGIQQVIVKTNDAFTFNYVFSVDDTQEFVYEKAVFGMLEKLFNGYNVTILAYGQTGSGKTHTMGTAFSGNFDTGTGVIPRAVHDIFKKISNINADYTATVSCSFVELYQEQLYDLLSTSSREQSVVDIREDGNRGIIMPGLTEAPVNSAKETTDFLMKGSAGRAVGATAMNSQSSRSHAIFTINIQMTHNTDSNRSTSSKFHLVDLAGSERAQKTKATGDRFKEGVKINQGLLALGNVISALGSGQNNGYIGYRDSKLTRLLQDSLGGNSVTLMIACVSPADYNVDETLSTLRYADRARKIKNKPIVNQDPKAAEINRLNGIIQKLRMELLAKGTGSGGDVTINNEELDGMRKNLYNLIEKNQMLQQQLQTTLHDVAEIESRATYAETAQEELQNKLLEAKDLVKSLNSNLDANSCPVEFVENSQRISKLKQFFGEVDEILEKTRVEMLNHKSSFSNSNTTLNQHNETSVTEVMQQKLEAFNSKQLNFNNELRRLNQELNLKEQLHQRVVGNLSKFCTYEGESSEEKIKEYESMIQILEAEKTELCGKLKNMKGAASAKIAEERRLRLQQLEQQISEMRKKNMQQSKMLKMREKESQKIENLNREIQAMKAAKVKLIRAMKAESENFRQWKLNRERELTVLKEKDKKRQHEMIKMESLHNRQKNVLKRKVEEAMAINKRLKDALDKQKSAQSQKKYAASGKIEQTIAWVDQELEIILSVIDAKYSLEQLMEDRAIINKRLKTLKEEINDDHAQEISSLEEDLQMRNAQINDLQQKIIASDIDSKMNGLCDGMTSMPQARGVLKHLLTALSDLRREHAGKESKIDEFKSVCETAEERIQNLQKDIQALEDHHREELSNVEKAYEEKISVLLRELNSVPQVTNGGVTPEMDERLKIQQETLDKLDNLREELENYKKLCADLEEAVKKPKSRKLAVKQEIDLEPVEELLTGSEEEDDDEIESSKDPDWKSTPRYRRNHSRNSREDKNTSKLVPIKRSSDGSTRCSCKTKCNTLKCSCKKNGTQCSENCKCRDICVNKWSEDKDENEHDSQEKIDVKQEIEEESIPEEGYTPKKIKLSLEKDDKLDVTTPHYPYAYKKRKPFLDV